MDRGLPEPQPMRDVSRTKPHRNEISRHWNQIALDMVTEPVVFFTALDSKLVQANRAACDYLGYSRQQLRRITFADIAPHAEQGDMADQIQRIANGSLQNANIQTVYRCQNGTLLAVQCSIRALRRGPTQLLVAAGKAIDGNEFIAPRVDNLVLDPLTGLPNRTWLWRQLEFEIRRAQYDDYQFAVLFLDVDRFKEINDAYGHLAGDRVLQAVGRRIRSSVRPDDDVARFGGDEFVVLMKNVANRTDVCRMMRRLGRSVSIAGRRPGTSWRVNATISIGAALCADGRLSAADAIDRADLAMYRAKALGGNGRFSFDDRAAMGGEDPKALAECSGRIA
jgi:diguanylate cyclase (GGDEF)-like protein/PAS domain S-box-containing protein